MPRSRPVKVARKVQATTFRNRYRSLAAGAKGSNVVLIENRRQTPKYLVDKEFFDQLVEERDRILATLEILADPKLTERLLQLGKTADQRLRKGKLVTYSMDEVFGAA